MTNRNYKECSKCGFSISTNNYEKHTAVCIGKGPYKHKHIRLSSGLYKCSGCGNEYSKYMSLVAHSKWCGENRDKTVRQLMEGFKKRKGGNQFTKARELGLSIPPHPSKGKKVDPSKRHKHTEETKEILRQKRIQYIKNGGIVVGGRCRKIRHFNPNEGEVILDGSLELKFAQWCESKNIEYFRNKKRFPYKDGDVDRMYIPDFSIRGIYIEVKGFETDLDRTKWAQFPKDLIVLKSHTIENSMDIFETIEDLKIFLYKPLYRS